MSSISFDQTAQKPEKKFIETKIKGDKVYSREYAFEDPSKHNLVDSRIETKEKLEVLGSPSLARRVFGFLKDSFRSLMSCSGSCVDPDERYELELEIPSLNGLKKKERTTEKVSMEKLSEDTTSSIVPQEETTEIVLYNHYDLESRPDSRDSTVKNDLITTPCNDNLYICNNNQRSKTEDAITISPKMNELKTTEYNSTKLETKIDITEDTITTTPKMNDIKTLEYNTSKSKIKVDNIKTKASSRKVKSSKANVLVSTRISDLISKLYKPDDEKDDDSMIRLVTHNINTTETQTSSVQNRPDPEPDPVNIFQSGETEDTERMFSFKSVFQFYELSK